MKGSIGIIEEHCHNSNTVIVFITLHVGRAFAMYLFLCRFNVFMMSRLYDICRKMNP